MPVNYTLLRLYLIPQKEELNLSRLNIVFGIKVSRPNQRENEHIPQLHPVSALPEVRSPSLRIHRRIIFDKSIKSLLLTKRPTLPPSSRSRAKRQEVRGEATLHYPKSLHSRSVLGSWIFR
ncbi:hypothetical protein CEXT_9241 [Caerostris extrusa]|uniref:Uncharacterized protein n=1 Tax=Caerostris extrusa TaxID=172846 RepID=A0AAV4N9W8_CAEEX|nr:hypothetical protein CEXT_9241 [Caerostris extrusa]